MEHSLSSKGDIHSATNEIPPPPMEPKVYYRVHKSLSFVPILNQMNPVHIFPSNFAYVWR
jgi:hypothetical protein